MFLYLDVKTDMTYRPIRLIYDTLLFREWLALIIMSSSDAIPPRVRK